MKMYSAPLRPFRLQERVEAVLAPDMNISFAQQLLSGLGALGL